jgi:transaldolase/glucose-6-phosphate isomerase
MEDLRAAGGDLSSMASVASFFVSRVDSKIDKMLDARIAGTDDPRERRRLESMLGKAGIANSKMAYQEFLRLHSGPRWEALAGAGARPQRCLWASTSTKDPRYPDTMYVEELIGPQTVDTVPPATLAAFREHGEVRRSLDENVPAARRHLEALAEIGIELDQVTRELEVEGVEVFGQSFENLLNALRNASRAIRAGKGPRQWSSLGRFQTEVQATAARLQAEEVPRRLWAKDPTLWTSDPARRQDIVDRLGWLNVAEKMQQVIPRLQEVASEARSYKDAVLLGMGGSSLCPDVLRRTFGPQRGQPRLHVLDTTDPSTILRLRGEIEPGYTLFIVASKSGETTETLSHFAYFWQEVAQAGVKDPGHNFAAITDPGTSLEQMARGHGFRWVFLNPPDIGGRYSALSYFGLVPGSVLGLDVGRLLDRAVEMAHSCDASVPVEANPGVWLGTVMGALALEGRDKLTLVPGARVASFGYWVEQLIAESTGKQGKGIVPVEGEPLGEPSAYGDDRLFVELRLDGERAANPLEQLEKAGQPTFTIRLRDRYDLGGEFLRWEVATAVAGSIMGIDPFDQPNVQESKDNTRRVLAEFEKSGRLPAADQVAAAEAEKPLRRLLADLGERSYFAVMAYTAATPASERALREIRTRVRDRCRAATTAGYGPRFLHSTGQLHKGGPPGVFLQIVQQEAQDVPIPGQPYGFATLKAAQSLGDLRSLESRRLPVLRVDLGRRPNAGWKALLGAIESALG